LIELDPKYSLPNTYTDSASGSCDVGSRVNLKKLTEGAVDPAYDWQFGVFDGPNVDHLDDSFLATPLATDGTFGVLDGVLDFGLLNLDPTQTYTICEFENSAVVGWDEVWGIDTDGDGVADVGVTTYDVFDDADPRQNTGVTCADFGANTSLPLVAGETLAFVVDNQRPPGGQPRTPGYWKNWSSCTNGNQWEKATVGDPNDEFTALDELLQTNEYHLGLLTLGMLGGEPSLPSTYCEDAVNILDHSNLSGKKSANDAAYKLARSLLAYELNQDATACPSPTAANAAAEAHALLEGIEFDGTGKNYLRPKNELYQDALDLHGTLDDYNNGMLCGS
jgi:hypothetical protein